MKKSKLTQTYHGVEQRWYMSIMPNGNVWCETRSLPELMEQAKHYSKPKKLRHVVVKTYVTNYEPVHSKLSKKRILKEMKR